MKVLTRSVDIEWEQVDDRLTITVNGASHTFTLLEGSPLIGNYICFGNRYDIEGEVEVDDVTLQQ